MIEILLVFIGGSIGASLRYLLSGLCGYSCWGTMGINIIGSLFIGFVSYLTLKDEDLMHPHLKIFLTTGIAGGFTTFSAFGYDIFNMIKTGQIQVAMIYLTSSYLLSLLAVVVGFGLAKLILSYRVVEEFVDTEDAENA